MKNLRDLAFDIEYRSHTGTENVMLATVIKMEALAKKGFKFIIGNHPCPKVKPYDSREAVKVSQVNSPTHGKSIRTIWAVKGRASITLSNDFHNTSIRLVPIDRLLSAQQVKRAKRKLCGIRGCKCSDELGRRGPQAVEVETNYHSSTGKLTAIVTDEE